MVFFLIVIHNNIFLTISHHVIHEKYTTYISLRQIKVIFYLYSPTKMIAFLTSK